MAIQSLADVLAAVAAGRTAKSIYQKATSNAATSSAGRVHELFTASGVPVAGAFSGTAGVATAMNSSTVGRIPCGGIVTPNLQHLLNLSTFTPTATGILSRLILVDMLLYYPSLVVTGAPTALNNTVTLPRYTNGEGVMAAAFVQTALGATQPALTFTYTNQAGTTGRVAPAVTAPAVSAPISTAFQKDTGLYMPPALSSSDTGVRKLESYTLATGTTGTVAAVLMKPIFEIPVIQQYAMVQLDTIAQIPSFPQIQDDACLAFILMTGQSMVAACSFQGSFDTVWG